MNNNDKQLNRKFGLVTGIAFLVIYVCLLVFKHSNNYLPGVTGLLLLLTAFILPNLLNPIRIFWSKAGEILGIINTAIILGIMFFLIIIPVGALLRLFKKTTIQKDWRKQAVSYWQPTEPPGKGSYEQQF